MERKAFQEKNSDRSSLFDFIFDNAQGTPLNLKSAPTTAGKELKTNQWGKFSNNLYININGTIFSLALTIT